MKLATYNPVVNKNTINGVPVRAYDDGSAAYMRQAAAQTEAAGRIAANIGQMQGKNLQGIANTIQHVGEQIDAVNVQAASNEYSKRLNELLYNQDNGLMNTKMQGADGITQKFEEAERKIRQEVGNQYQFFSAKGNMVFNRMTDNSAAQRYEMVRRHQTQQFEAYQDQTFNNALELNTQTAADNFAMPDVVDQNMKEAIASVRMRYTGQGEEVVKAQERKVVGVIAQQVINRAYAQGDLDSAETYIEKYGRYMNPQTLTGYAKNVYASRMATMQEVTAKSLFAQFGDNMEAAYNYINSAEFGGSGNSASSVAWFKDMSDKGAGWGVNTCTKGVNAALQAGGYKPINTWAPTAWEEEKAAGRTFTNRSKLRNGDIVYWDSAGDNDASHVGIYDAKTGMVYQSGTSGFAPINIDTYKLIGFSHPRGKAATPEDRKKLFAAYQHEATLHKQFKAQALQRTKEAMDDAMFDLSESGETNPATYEAIVAQYAGGDPEAARIGRRLMKGYVSVTGKANGAGVSNAKAIPGFKESVTDMLVNGMSPTKVLEWVGDDDSIGAKDAAIAKELVRQHAKGEGAFKYEWQDVKQKIMLGYRDKDKDYAWSGVKNILYDKISQYRAEHGGQNPSEEWVVATGESILTDPIKYNKSAWYGTSNREVKGYMLGNKNIVSWSDNPQGGKNITIKEGHIKRTIHVSDEQFARIVEQGMTVEQAINER